MSDQDESRPLTRRELRLREMAAAGAEPEAPEPAVEAAPIEAKSGETEIEISMFDENGRMRSRRELRELRMQAEERAAAEGAAVEAETAVESPSAEQSEIEKSGSEGTEAEAVTPSTGVAQAEAVEQAEAQPEPSDAVASEQLSAEAQGSQSQPEAQSAEQPPTETMTFDVIAAEQETETGQAVTGEVSLEDEQESAVDGEAADGERAVDEVATQESAAEEPAPESIAAPVTAQPSQGYSFPDIAPLDEGQSVFDDPATRMMGAAGAQPVAEPTGGDFDALINRAVAQEGASGSSNTSALILPNMPESEGLAGPLGDSGELFITGSIDLPKSLSETGGHSALHDSVEVEPLDKLSVSESAPAGQGMAPVSASQAVSARGAQGPLVAEAGKDKSKMPVVLIATGGVLVLGAAGLIIWAATSGLFG